MVPEADFVSSEILASTKAKPGTGFNVVPFPSITSGPDATNRSANASGSASGSIGVTQIPTGTPAARTAAAASHRASSGGAFGSNARRTSSLSVGTETFTRTAANCRKTSRSRVTSGPRVCTSRRGAPARVGLHHHRRLYPHGAQRRSEDERGRLPRH